MFLGALSLITAIGGAGWLLWRLARNNPIDPAKSDHAGDDGGAHDEGRKNVLILKVVALLLLTAVLFATQFRAIAFMVLLAAGGVMAIESWREKHISDTNEGAMPLRRPPSVEMGADEAYAVLGLEPGADHEAVMGAHKKLIAQIHPDKGGTDYLAAKINSARDVLMNAQKNITAASDQENS